MTNNFTIKSEMKGDIPMLVMEGNITTEVYKKILEEYQSLDGKFDKKVLFMDFQKVEYSNSSGFSALFSIIQDMQENGGKVKCIGMSPFFLQLMNILNMLKLVETYETMDEAMASL